MFRRVRIAVVLASVLALALPVVAQQAGAGKGQDAQLQAEINGKLKEKEELRNVRANVQSGLATLDGSVQLYRDKLRAARLAGSVRGAEGVRNRVEVQTDRVPDEQLRETLAEKLAYDRIDRGQMFNYLTLGVENGVVTVGGDVRDDIDRDSALDIVAKTPGVVDIVDRIHISGGSAIDDRARIRVARAIYGDPMMQKYRISPLAPIRIVVEKGTITLYGVVDSQIDHTTALLRAREVAGTYDVVDRLEIASKRPK